ncbi:MAG: CvpA family protein [Anaerorhabdus sp.]
MNQVMLFFVGLAVIGFYVIMFIKGYRKGFIAQLISLLGLFLALYIGWAISPILATHFSILPASAIPLAGTSIASYIQHYLDKIIWFVIVVIVLKIILAFIVLPLVKAIQKLPIIKQLNGLLGCVFSVVISTIWILILATILSFPGFKIGNEIANGGIIKFITDKTIGMVKILEEPLLANEELENFFENADQLTDAELDRFEQWIESLK